VAVGDIPTITAIYDYHVTYGTASWELTPPSEAEMQRRMGSMLGQGYPYLVAELDGQVVGYSYVSSYRPRPGYRFTVENSVYVDTAYQGRGVGRLLLTGLIQACSQRPYRQMVAVIGDSQNQASLALHRSLGFIQVGLLSNIGYKFGRWLDSVLMQRSLGPGETSLPQDEE
jgi:phosphinothricin acetyltransferase